MKEGELKMSYKGCSQCGREFEFPDKDGNYKKFCSKECSIMNQYKKLIPKEELERLYYKENLSIDKIAEKYEVYPQTIQLLMKRFGVTTKKYEVSPIKKYQIRKVECVLCETKEHLVVHHIDGEPSNNRIENLTVLCTRCHCILHRCTRNKKLTNSFKNDELAKQLYLTNLNAQSEYALHGYDREIFNDFISKMRTGLVAGEYKYGNGAVISDNMFEMMEEELRDVVNYSYLLYLKIQWLKKKFLDASDLKEFTGKESKNSFRRTHK